MKKLLLGACLITGIIHADKLEDAFRANPGLQKKLVLLSMKAKDKDLLARAKAGDEAAKEELKKAQDEVKALFLSALKE